MQRAEAISTTLDASKLALEPRSIGGELLFEKNADSCTGRLRRHNRVVGGIRDRISRSGQFIGEQAT